MPLNWSTTDQNVRSAFNGEPIAITLQPGMKLWKLTAYKPSNPNINRLTGPNITPWWSSVNKFQEDTMSVKDILNEANLNKVSFQQYIRNRSAVTIEWNRLTYYMQVTLVNAKDAFWGKIAPQNASRVAYQTSYGGQYYPEFLGGWDDAYQLYIPNLQTADLSPVELISSTDAKALQAEFASL